MARAQAIHQKYANAAPTPRPAPAPAPRPAAQLDRIAELCSFITKPRKPLLSTVAKTKQPTADKFNAITITAEGITSHSQRGGRAMKQSISNQKTKSKI
jgi:hypothetical protein